MYACIYERMYVFLCSISDMRWGSEQGASSKPQNYRSKSLIVPQNPWPINRHDNIYVKTQQNTGNHTWTTSIPQPQAFPRSIKNNANTSFQSQPQGETRHENSIIRSERKLISMATLGSFPWHGFTQHSHE